MLLAGGLLTACNIALSSIRDLPVGSYMRRFDQQLWKSSSSLEERSDAITMRQQMLGDVIRSVVRNNSKESIVKLLGPSEDDSYFSESGRDLIYNTGPQRDSVMRIDSEWLLIWFDSSGRASRYEIRSD
jgi:hypothetical protein